MTFSKNKRGFTLIEMIVALSIFVLTVLMATNIYLLINNAQRKVVAMQRVQDDVRYLFEAISQEIRLGQINYGFYDDNNIDLHPEATEENVVLAIITQSGEQVFYRRSSVVEDANDGLGDAVQYCTISAANDCAIDDEIDDITGESKWQNITPASVATKALRFTITPSADPFVSPGDPVDCLVGGDSACVAAGRISYRCEAGTCKYFSDDRNYQPKVGIVLQAEAININLPEVSRTLTMQTLISSRLLPNTLQNVQYY